MFYLFDRNQCIIISANINGLFWGEKSAQFSQKCVFFKQKLVLFMQLYVLFHQKSHNLNKVYYFRFLCPELRPRIAVNFDAWKKCCERQKIRFNEEKAWYDGNREGQLRFWTATSDWCLPSLKKEKRNERDNLNTVIRVQLHDLSRFTHVAEWF